MTDAVQAQMRVKEILAPGSAWAQTDCSDPEVPAVDDPCRMWSSETEGIVPAAVHYDLGLRSRAEVDERARSLHRSYETEMASGEIVDISCIDLVFQTVEQLLAALDVVTETFDVAWIDNRFRFPTCLGQREVSIGVHVPAKWPPPPPPEPEPTDEKEKRKREKEKAEQALLPPPGPLEREHIAEIKLHLGAIFAVRQGPGNEKLVELNEQLEEFGVDPKHIAAVKHIL